jgi:hypothetical protein
MGLSCNSRPHQTGLTVPSVWNVLEKSAIATMCVLCGLDGQQVGIRAGGGGWGRGVAGRRLSKVPVFKSTYTSEMVQIFCGSGSVNDKNKRKRTIFSSCF